MLTVYGIKNCNTMKKCFDYLNNHQIAYQFVDYKKQVPDFNQFCQWVEQFGLNKLINKQGTTYKKLSEDDKVKINNAIAVADDKAMQVVYDFVGSNPSMIKRPIVLGDYQGKSLALIGFDLALYDAAFAI